MGDIVLIDLAGGVATVTLNRPEKKNALSMEMFTAIAEAGEGLKAVAGLRAVILTGAGGDFCAGLDFAAMGQLATDLDAIRARLATPLPGGKANWFQKPSTVWAELPVPVIAAIQGVCLGGGLQIALGADIRLARPDARLSIMESRWGLIPDMGITQSLPRLMRADHAKRLMMTAEMVTGERAAALGLVTELAEDPMADARALAAGIAARSPDAVAGIKRLVDSTWTLPEGEGLAVEAALQAPIIGAPNQVEAVAANMQKRPPRFR